MVKRTPTTPELHWTEVDGVKTVWVQGPKPSMASLVFRTGRIDETLATSGWTHLIEHLVMWTFGDVTSSRNGSVGGAQTSFTSVGQGQETSAFLAGVCRALKSLPRERLEAEKRILEAESGSRPRGLTGGLLTTRYGAQGYGLLGLRELGFRGVKLEQLQSLVQERFTRDNAFLWLSGPPPGDLRLDLPEGAYRPIAPLVPVVETTPSWFLEDDIGGIAAGATVPRDAASSVFRVMCGKALHEQLRAKSAVSYAPLVDYDYLDARVGHLLLYADSDRERRAELAEGFADVVEILDRFTEPEVEAARKELVDHWTGSLAPPPEIQVVGEAQRAAMDWVCGREFEPLETLASEAASVGVVEAGVFGREVQRQALFAVPGATALKPIMGDQLPMSVGRFVKGRRVSHVDSPVRPERLVYGQEGVSLCFPGGSHSTVRYADLAGAITNEDGRVGLIANDGASVLVEPTLWRGGTRVCREIRKRVPQELLLDQGSRNADAIPGPSTTKWQRFWAWLRYRRAWILLGVLVVVFVTISVLEGQLFLELGLLALLLVLLVVRGIRRR